MPHLSCVESGDATQREVIVLAPLVALAEATHLADQPVSVHPQVADVVLGEEQVRVPGGFEVRVISDAGFVDLVLVAEEHVHVGTLCCGEHHGSQRMGLQDVVVVQQRDPVPRRELQGAVRSGRDMAVLIAAHGSDSWIECRVLGEDGRDVRRRRGIVGDAEFPVLVPLGTHGVDRQAEPHLVGVVDRHHDRHQRLLGESVDRLSGAGPVCLTDRVERSEPVQVRNRSLVGHDQLAARRIAPTQSSHRRTRPLPEEPPDDVPG